MERNQTGEMQMGEWRYRVEEDDPGDGQSARFYVVAFNPVNSREWMTQEPYVLRDEAQAVVNRLNALRAAG